MPAKYLEMDVYPQNRHFRESSPIGGEGGVRGRETVKVRHNSLEIGGCVQGRSLRLLIADDNLGDINLFKMALGTHRVAHEVHTVHDGEAVMDFLRRRGRYAAAPRIDLVVLDINMPKRNGHEVLQDLKADPDLQSIPVVMLTSSVHQWDVFRAYELHANCYIQKPSELDAWFEVVHAIEEFWLRIVALPRSH